MSREDRFVGLIKYKDGSIVAEFEHATPFYNLDTISGHLVKQTNFRLDFSSLLARIENLKLPKNCGKIPWSFVNEYAALDQMLKKMFS